MKYILNLSNNLIFGFRWNKVKLTEFLNKLFSKKQNSSNEDCEQENIIVAYLTGFVLFFIVILWGISYKLFKLLESLGDGSKNHIDHDESNTNQNESSFDLIPLVNSLENKKIIDPIVPKYTAEDLINKMLFEMSSDIGCGRHGQAQKTMSYILRQDEDTMNAFVKVYIKMKYHQNPKMFYLTMLLFKKCRNNLTIEKMNSILEMHSFYFTLDNLKAAIKFLGKDLAIGGNKILLILYYTNQFDKMNLLIKIGYNPRNLKCKDITHFCRVPDGDSSEAFLNYLTFSPKPEIKGKYLTELIYKNKN